MTTAASSNALRHLRPGEIVEYDFRTGSAKASSINGAGLEERGLRIIQWNIERGYQLDRILQDLREADADVILLQELDINCERTEFADVPHVIAQALAMHCFFVVEFEELHSATRTHENRVGRKPGSGRAYHGNAILSRHHTLRDPRCIEHSFNLDWDKTGVTLKEPRIGTRSLLTCCINDGQNILHLYTLHLEIFCGMLGRVRQLSDALHDANTLLAQQKASGKRQSLRFIIAGDLNTVGHSIVRLSKDICTDRMRWMSLGENEADWLQRKVIAKAFEARRGIIFGLWNACFGSSLAWRLLYGFSAEEHARLNNAHLAFYDPFHKYHEVTLNNKKYRGFVQGKLDWVLLSNIKAKHTRVFNRDFGSSDHCGLLVDCEFPAFSEPHACYVPSARELFPTVIPYLIVRIALVYVLRWLFQVFWTLLF
jgi:endonuclease/exonuclease/phosphatase family metal-dependent hydrolase